MFKYVRTTKTQYFSYRELASEINLYRHTVFLPKTKFPLRIDTAKHKERDKNVHKLGAFDKLYDWQETHLNNPEYIIHDGPPYANGKPHMGHAINKILKDIILRYKILDGRKVNYIPGWDCHGLPIELKALAGVNSLDAVHIRSKANSFADETIQEQMNAFLSWGVIGDWKNHYETKSIDYMENQLKQFFKMYECGLIYRDVKPIYWSPSSRTALAEAELEYGEHHRSPSVYLRLEVKEIPEVPTLSNKRVYGVIWTTTPWTLPSNQAVCYNESLNYFLIKKSDHKDEDLYIVAEDRFDNFCEQTNCDYQVLAVHTGSMLHGATYTHPIYKNQTGIFLHSSHVKNTKGTGLVHTAPAHDPDDFLVGITNKMSIVDLTTEEGCYKPEAGEQFANKYVLTDGNETVLRYIEKDILHKSNILHSYPYDWRTKEPVIIRASKQWFIDTDKIKHRAVELLEEVTFVPQEKSELYKKILISQLQKRIYWCISRQRKWGVPIPVFYQKDSNRPEISSKILDHICTQLRKNGTDFWWKLPIEQLLPPGLSPYNYIKGEDIMDIWFDSGISWSYVLKDKIADLYLEGVDQFTGWFQSSLITSVALKDRAPYKTIFVHGFAVDKNGTKMSKSLGNVVDPTDVIYGSQVQKAFGTDTLRWWVACHASQVSLASISDNILEHSREEVQKIRSILRFAVGALVDYRYDERDFQNTRLADRYMLHLLHQFYMKTKTFIDAYSFHKINTSLMPLLTNEISAFYYTSIKDRLYCELASSSTRRSAQYTLLHLYYVVSQIVGGILPHLTEECYAYLPQNSGRTFFTSKKLEVIAEWENFKVEKAMNVILDVKNEINKICKLRSTLNADVKIVLSEDGFEVLKPFMNEDITFYQDLKDILQISKVNVNKSSFTEDRKFQITLSESCRYSCPRCRLVQSITENKLCPRCQKIIETLNINKNIFAL